jgi:hypothetical protein
MRRVILMALALATVFAGQASAQSGMSLVDISYSSGAADLAQADVRATGAITVEFRGDPAAGCEAAGNCDVAGVVEWTPAHTGSLFAFRDRRSGHVSASLDLSGFPDTPSGTAASVQRGGGSPCSDASGAFGVIAAGESPESRVTLAIGGPEAADIFDTRCPGPLMEDVRAALGQAPSVGFKALRRGARFDFGAVRPFSANGLAGTVRSTLVARVTKLDRRPGDVTGRLGQPGRNARRIRTLAVDYAVGEVSGRVPVAFAGLADPEDCLPLDSCGVTGTSVLEPRADGGSLTFLALAPARRPSRDLRAALGLGGRGNPRGIFVSAVGSWQGSGSITTEAARPGSPTCRDSAALAVGLLDAERGRNSFRLRYDALPGNAGPRTRCHGPVFGTSGTPATLATGSVPFAALRDPIAAVHLRTGSTLSDDGYSVTTRPDIAIGLERRSVRESTFPIG